MFRPVLQAHPAETLAALGARHVTAASILLQGVMAARTSLHFHVGDLYSSGFQPIFVTWEINVPKSDKSNRQRCVQVCSKRIKPHLLPTLSPCLSILGKSVTWSGPVFQPCLQSIFFWSPDICMAHQHNLFCNISSRQSTKCKLKFWTLLWPGHWWQPSNISTRQSSIWWSAMKWSYVAKRSISSEDKVETVIFWLHAPSLLPWPLSNSDETELCC